MTIQEGRAAPPFTLPDQDGNPVSLKDFAGKNVILYFYPKDDTPGCTKEACAFRDRFGELRGADAVVLGVSPDAPGSHRDFIDKYDLPFLLLSDVDRKVMTKYGAWGEKVMYGKRKTGVIRSTVWIGPDGKVKKHWGRVSGAATHPEKVLAALKA